MCISLGRQSEAYIRFTKRLITISPPPKKKTIHSKHISMIRNILFSNRRHDDE